MQTIDVYQIASDVQVGRIGTGIGQQQAEMAVAALRGANSVPGLPDESPHSQEEPEDGFSLDWWMACPYCCARTYRMTFTPVEAGLLASGECSRCHTKGQSLLDCPQVKGP
jgi:hypothetical protein